MSIRRSARLTRTRAGTVAAGVAIAALLAGAGGAMAHVNRTVGPYTILVILVEEPTYQDNHAGFQFWVRRDGAPIQGLERSIQATAIGHDTIDDLAVPPLDASGWYVLDRTATGTAFDPLGGGSWLLRLTGSIEGTTFDEPFAVTFPGYPRIGAGQPSGGGRPSTNATSAAGADGGLSVWLAALVLVLTGGATWLVVSRRRRRPAVP